MKNDLKNTTRKVAVLLLGAGVSLSSLNSCSNLSDSALTMLQGTGIGAVGGAAAGTGIGAAAASLSGGDSKDVKKAMVIGAVAGAVVGGVIGNRWGASVVKKKEAYANVEQYINANIKQMDTRIAQASKLNNSLNKQIASIQKSGQKLASADKAKLKKTLSANMGLIQTDINNATAAMKDSETTSKQREQLRAKVAALESQRKALGATISKFNSVA